MPHRRRPVFVAAQPLHVTLRAVDAVRCLRAGRVFPAVRQALAAASRPGFRLVEFSVQRDHLHLLVEIDRGGELAAGMRGLAIRVARAVNRALGRRGPVWAERFHARALATPRETRAAVRYILLNGRRHGVAGAIDPCSSGPWFDGWQSAPPPVPAGGRPVQRARTWLATHGWRRGGLIGLHEAPAAGPRQPSALNGAPAAGPRAPRR